MYHHRLIRKMLQDALKTELVYRNVADAVDAPKKEKPEIKPLLKQDVPKLLKVLRNTYLYIPTLIAIATGARQGEVLGLQWKDVNLKEKTIFFRQQLQRFKNSDGEYEMVLRPLKTKKSVRRMDIPDSLVFELQKHRLEQKKQRLAAGETWQDHGFVCSHQDGRPIIPFTLGSYFRVMARRAGLEISFHGLPHGHATELISAGMQMNAVRDRLGHSEV
ncbi:MAG: tyrosine-type recombinase/integrase [Bacillota bacterium]